jgi:hypothetical protein
MTVLHRVVTFTRGLYAPNGGPQVVTRRPRFGVPPADRRPDDGPWENCCPYAKRRRAFRRAIVTWHSWRLCALAARSFDAIELMTNWVRFFKFPFACHLFPGGTIRRRLSAFGRRRITNPPSPQLTHVPPKGRAEQCLFRVSTRPRPAQTRPAAQPFRSRTREHIIPYFFLRVKRKIRKFWCGFARGLASCARRESTSRAAESEAVCCSYGIASHSDRFEPGDERKLGNSRSMRRVQELSTARGLWRLRPACDMGG